MTGGDFDGPITPYGTGRDATSGWSGSDASEARARGEDADGTTFDRQRRVVALVVSSGADGVTWRELSAAFGWHHGQATGALSVLHKTGRIARLATVKRDRCSVYVLPEHVQGRDVATHGRAKPSPLSVTDAAFVDAVRGDVEVTTVVPAVTAARLIAILDRFTGGGQQ